MSAVLAATGELSTLVDVVRYLKMDCRTRGSVDGRLQFEVRPGHPDKTREVIGFFADNTQYCVSINPRVPFLCVWPQQLHGLNEHLTDEDLKFPRKISIDVPMSQKFR